MNKRDRLLKRTIDCRPQVPVKDKERTFQQAKRQSYSMRGFGNDVTW